jgi:methyl-accepting chemotaxis protein/streptogramin lyase
MLPTKSTQMIASKHFFILCVCFFSLQLNAQRLPNHFRHLTTDQGLSTGTVNFVFTDSNGFIWIGTINGLNRFDGYSIEIFKQDSGNPNSISDNSINCMAEDSEGKLWIGTRNGGISVYDYNSGLFSHYPQGEKGLPSGQVRDIEFLPGGDALIASHGGGLVFYEKKSDKFFPLTHDPGNPKSLSNNIVFSITPDQLGRFWIGTHSGTLDRFHLANRTFEHFTYDPDFNKTQTNRKPIFVDSKKRVWIGTDGDGFYMYHSTNNRFKYYDHTMMDGLRSGIITTFFEDKRGLIMIGTDGQGVHVLDPKTDQFTHITNSDLDPHSISSDAIYDIYEDPSGVIWISTFRGGVNIYSPKRSKFARYKKEPGNPNSLSFNSVIEIMEDSNGMIWVGTDGGGLDRFDPNTGNFEHFRHDSSDPSSISGDVAISLCEDHQGYIWVGTYATGLNRLDTKTGKFKRYQPDLKNPQSIGSRNVWNILEDRNLNLWIGTLDGGLDRFDRQSQTFFHYQSDNSDPTSISSNLIISMLEDSRGHIWIGTEDGGLNLFDPKNGRFKSWQHDQEDPDSFINNNVKSLMEYEGQLWIGTAEGIAIIDLNTLELIPTTINERLSSRVINGLQLDNDGYIWIASNSGLSRLQLSNKKILHFTKEDGLQGSEFNYGSSTRSRRTQELYFGGINGFNVFQPEDIQLSSFSPGVVLTSIRIMDRELNPQTTINDQLILSQSLLATQAITLPYDHNTVSFEFASLDYNSPTSNQYQFQLIGFDKQWQSTDHTNRKANYTNLDPGHYQFIVKGSNSDGVWSDQTATLAITITPPWWSTWWFRLLMGVAILGSVFSFYRWRVNSIKAQKRRLEWKVQEATEQISKQNNQLVIEQKNLQSAIEETNEVVKQALESGNFNARIDTSQKSGAWLHLGDSINALFESITAPFAGINRVINAMSQSDLTLRYQEEAKGDIERLTSNMNHALDILGELLQEIKSQSKIIDIGAREMLGTAEEMNQNTAEISSSISQMASGASAQVQKIDESSKVLEGILSLANQVSLQADSINAVAKSGVSESTEGTKIIQHMYRMMNEIKKVSVATNESLDILIKQSEEIGQVIRMIQEISGETNLLSLNATIEAAKAGESGRGFAVIAEQIRRLSEDATQSSQSIEQMIQKIQQAVDRTDKEMRGMSKSIEQGESSATEALQAFEQLASKYQESYDLSQEILKASNSQNSEVTKVVSFIEGVVVISEQTAAGTEEIAASSHELSTGMSEFARSSGEVSMIISELTEKINQFKLKNSG